MPLCCSIWQAENKALIKHQVFPWIYTVIPSVVWVSLAYHGLWLHVHANLTRAAVFIYGLLISIDSSGLRFPSRFTPYQFITRYMRRIWILHAHLWVFTSRTISHVVEPLEIQTCRGMSLCTALRQGSTVDENTIRSLVRLDGKG